MSKLELQLLPTEQLLQEIFARFENAIFVGQKAYTDTTQTSKSCMWRYRGDPFLCLGLSSTLESILNEDISFHTTPTDPGSL